MRITALRNNRSLGVAARNHYSFTEPRPRGSGILLAILLLPITLAAAEQTPFTSIAKLATAFSEADPDGALDFFDSQMKGYGEIEQKIEALTAQADISCAIDVVTDTETGDTHKLDLDWLMTLKPQNDDSQVERRRERVQIEMRLIKGVWKITSLTPVSILDPIHIR
ncbi:MAG TPA: hypothetical protein VG297_12235 [Bryobacteraceae bacterium]|nr:hypothetical protein [Bryobacteraceae bacterium]